MFSVPILLLLSSAPTLLQSFRISSKSQNAQVTPKNSTSRHYVLRTYDYEYVAIYFTYFTYCTVECRWLFIQYIAAAHPVFMIQDENSRFFFYSVKDLAK